MYNKVNRGEVMFIRTENFQQFRTYYPVVFTLICINVIVFIVTSLPVIGDKIFYASVNVNGLVANGEIWRVITSTFIHAGFLHLLFNMFSLFLFGPELERIAGKLRFLTIYLLGGIVGNVATFLTQDSFYATVGASGAIFGIFGAYLAILARHHRYTPQLKQVILPIVVISVILTFFQSNVNAAGHIGGLIGGFAVGMIYFTQKRIIRWRNLG